MNYILIYRLVDPTNKPTAASDGWYTMTFTTRPEAQRFIRNLKRRKHCEVSNVTITAVSGSEAEE
jgi:hypothetical protein